MSEKKKDPKSVFQMQTVRMDGNNFPCQHQRTHISFPFSLSPSFRLSSLGFLRCFFLFNFFFFFFFFFWDFFFFYINITYEFIE